MTSSTTGFSPTGGTVEFNGNSAQTISLASGEYFYDLKINNSHASDKVSAQGSALVVDNHLNIADGIFESASDYNDVTIASGATLELTGDITVSGNWTNNGTFIAGSHTAFDGSTVQSISGSNSFLQFDFKGSVVTLQSDLNILNNLTVSSISTFDFNSRIVTISGATDINGTLTASTGFFDANGAFDATGGTVQFTATGNLKLGSTVTSLGTLQELQVR